MTAVRRSLRFGDSTIEYEVHRSKRRKKTVQLTVDGGGVRVAAPSAMPLRDVDAFVRERAAWVLKKLTSTPPKAASKQFVSGETLPYLGCDVLLTVEAADVYRPVVRFDSPQLYVALPRVMDDGKREGQTATAVMLWYSDRAEEVLKPSVERWAFWLGHENTPRVLVRSQRRLWGSCAPDGTLRFNWRVAMLAPDLIELVVVHEVAHLKVKNHSKDFWGLVAKAVPDVQERRKRLREAGREIFF